MTVPMIKSIGDVPYPIDTHSDVFSPLLTAGAALGITGDVPTDSAAWLQRVSTSDGPTTIRSIHGRTLRWNQLVSDSDTSVTVPSGHKYVARIDGTTTLATSDGTAITVTGGTDNVFDLTAMFGAGSEPSTIEEFTALYPADYYAYDAGSLLSVNMEGVETTGFNQWDEKVVKGYFDGSGEWSAATSNLSSENPIQVLPGATYYISAPTGSIVHVTFWKSAVPSGASAADEFVPYLNWSSNYANTTVTVPEDARYMHFNLGSAYGTTYNHDICINLSWSGRRNGEYEAFWKSQRLIDVASYFPDGMRSAGSVYDELTSTEAIQRVGEVDLGTLTWTYNENNEAFYTGTLPIATSGYTNALVAPMTCSKYDTVVYYGTSHFDGADKVVAYAFQSGSRLYVKDTSLGTDAAAFKAAMSGVMLHYALATPTTTTFDTPINMTYRTEQGGTERVMVPTGENSAPPTLVTAQGYTAESLRDAALSAIAPVENGLASTNYGVGSYLVHGGQLCKVTTAIATGESITIGTNVTTTTVMAEVIALIAQ